MSGKRQRSTETLTAATGEAATNSSSNKPLRVFRARGVSVAVFENHTTIEGRAVTFLKAELRRVYRDGEQFKTTHALSANDIPVARLLLARAFEFMLEPGQENDCAAGPMTDGAGADESPNDG